MARYCQRSERTEMPSIFQRDEAERDDDEKNGLFMYMPAKEERGIAAECHSAYKIVPCGLDEQLDQGDGLKDQGKDEAHPRANIREHCERSISDEPSSNAVERLRLDWQPEARSDWRSVSLGSGDEL